MDFRLYQDGDEQAIVGLFQATFRRPLSVEAWRWRFLHNPDGLGVVELAWDGSILAGHYAVTPITMELDGEALLTGLSGTTMTHPEYQGPLGLFPKLAKRCYDRMQERGFGMVWGFPNASSHRGFVRLLQWNDVCEVPTLRLALALDRPLEDGPSPVIETSTFDGRFDELWARSHGRHRLMRVRSAPHLDWRYRQNPLESYRTLTISDGPTLKGYLIFKRYRDEVQIVDLLAEDDGSWATELVRRTIALAGQLTCRSVALWCSLHQRLHATLEGLGFQNGAIVTYLGTRAFSASVAAITADYRNWNIQMGDSDVY